MCNGGRANEAKRRCKTTAPLHTPYIIIHTYITPPPTPSLPYFPTVSRTFPTPCTATSPRTNKKVSRKLNCSVKLPPFPSSPRLPAWATPSCAVQRAAQHNRGGSPRGGAEFGGTLFPLPFFGWPNPCATGRGKRCGNGVERLMRQRLFFVTRTGVSHCADSQWPYPLLTGSIWLWCINIYAPNA